MNGFFDVKKTAIKFSFSTHTNRASEVIKEVLYLQLKPRVTICPGERLLVRHVADAQDTNGAPVMDLPVECPSTQGVWKLPAMAVVNAVLDQCPEVMILGPPECFVHIVPRNKRNMGHIFRAVLAFVFLLVGSALAITWFHADVNMLDAQQSLYRLICGYDAPNQWFITVPYALGVFLGVSLFYALLGRKGTVSPLEIKLEEYRQTTEKATGRTP